MKLFRSASLFVLALVVSVSALAALFPENTVFAADPTYKWTGPNTIEATSLSAIPQPAIFGGSNGVFVSDPIYRVPTGSAPGDPGGGTCTFKATITIDQNDTSKGTLAVQRTDTLDRKLFQCPLNGGPITIANAQNGGQGLPNYATANCSDNSQNGGDQAKCDAVKKCVNDAKKSVQDCANAWDTCLTNLTNGGIITDANKKKCADAVSAGKLDEAKNAKDEGNKSQCVIQGVGWLVCPVMKLMSKLVDAAYSFVVTFLEIPPISTDTNGPVYKVWATMRNLGNVAFVIAFLIIIFSQVTNIGLSNYGIKKMLPRLVMAAILVNVSYWVCAAAVDLSNIVGNSMYGLFQAVAGQIPGPDASKFGSTAGGWEGITGGILAGTIATATGAAVYIGLSALIPLLITVLFIIIGIVITLSIRQALILILVVISPLIAVARLLPNTESLSNKGLKLFWTLLVMFPIVGALFGGSKLASDVLFQIAGNNIALELMASGISILPLIALFFIRQMVSAIGGTLGRFAGRINDPNKGLADRSRKAAEEFRKRQEGRREIQALNGGRWARITSGGKFGRRAKREAIAAGIEAEQRRARQLYVAKEAQSNDAFANRLAGGRTLGADASEEAIQRALAGAQFTIEKAEAEEVKAHHADIDKFDENELMNVIKNAEGNNSNTRIAAAMERLVKIGGNENIAEAINKYGTNGDKDSVINKTLASALASDGPGYLKASDIDNIARGQFGRDEKGNLINPGADHTAAAAAANIKSGVYSPEKLVGANNDELKYISDIADKLNTAGDSTAVDKLKAAAVTINKTPTLAGRKKHNGDNIDRLAAGVKAI